MNQGSVFKGMLWMLFISILLFWLPVLGPLLAGFVGGKKSGGVGSAILAVVLPGLIIGLGLALAATALTGVPVLGLAAGLGALTLVLMQVGTLLIGAIIGGVFAK